MLSIQSRNRHSGGLQSCIRHHLRALVEIRKRFEPFSISFETGPAPEQTVFATDMYDGLADVVRSCLVGCRLIKTRNVLVPLCRFSQHNITSPMDRRSRAFPRACANPSCNESYQDANQCGRLLIVLCTPPFEW